MFMSNHHKQSGVSLIEVLVSIVIVCFGLLGVAGLLTTGLRSTQSSEMRTRATYLAYDMADRMRSNRQVALNGEYDTSVTASNAVAVSDKTAWNNAVAALPSGGATITRTNQTLFKITIRWDDTNLAGGSATQSFDLVGEL